MAQYVDTPTKTFVAGGALAQHARVYLSSGKLAAAGVADNWIGTTTTETFADGDMVAVRLRGAPTSKYIAAGAITTGAKVYAAASGKVDDAITTEYIGIALPLNSEDSTTCAGANNDICEVLNLPGGQAYRIARGQHTTVDADDTVVTGLTTVVAAVASWDSAPIEAAKFLTCTIGDQAGAPAAGSIQIKTHKDTDADAAIVDATTFSLKINWVAIGT